MGRGGRKLTDEEGARRCIVTGDSQPRDGLIRFVLDPAGVVTPDIAERLPGRGMWVTADRDTLLRAVAKNPFSRAAKTRAEVPADLLDTVESLLARKVTDLISLARKSGDAICGFDKTRGALVADNAAILLQASDGSDPQKRKLRPPTGQNTYISSLTAAELGLAFGREHVIHAALAPGGLTDTIRAEARRLAGIRGGNATSEGKDGRISPAVKG